MDTGIKHTANDSIAIADLLSEVERPARQPLSLALVTETFAPEVNGVAMTLSRLVDGLRDRGHQVHLIRPRLPADYAYGCKAESRVPAVFRPGFPIPNYPLMRIGAPSLAILRATWRQSPPDVVHIATEGPLGYSALRAANSLGIPCTSSFHTNFDQYTAHYGLPFLGRMVGRFLQHVHNRSACTMVPTLDQAKDLHRQGYERVRLLSRGLDDRLFNPQRRDEQLRASWGATPDSLVFTQVGRVAAEKSLPLTVATFQAIRERHPDAVLVLVGDGPERRRFEGIDGVHCVGTKCGPDLARHYASADVFLFPSTTETYGNVVVEAMASGLAVVAFDYAAPAEVIHHDENGLRLPFGDTAAFKMAAVALADDPARITRLRQAATAVARRRRWSSVIGTFERYLHEAVDERRPT